VACGSPHQGTPKDSGNAEDDGGSTDTTIVDAPVTPDATPDALPEIPPSFECDVTQAGMVRVRTAGVNNPLVIHDVFGSVVSRTTSGPTGVVDVIVPGCGAVTAVTGNLYHTITYVRGGDELWINARPDTNASITIQGPARIYIDTPVPGATSYYVLGPIGASAVATDPLARDLFWGPSALDAQGLTTFVVQPTDSNSGDPALGTFHVFEDVSLANAMQSPLHVTTWTSQATTSVQLRLLFAQAMELVSVNLYSWWQDYSYWFRSTGPRNAAATQDVAIDVSSYGDGLTLRVPFRQPSNGNLHSHVQVIPFPQAQVVLDLSLALLPEIGMLTTTPSPLRPTFTWNLQGGSVGPDITILRVLGSIEWRFALPPGMTSYTLPELPADLAANFSPLNVGITLHEASDYPGYAVARGRFIETFIGPRKEPMGLVLRYTSYGDVAF
jgi:hypothetical protein